jgi:hypothetical protein
MEMSCWLQAPATLPPRKGEPPAPTGWVPELVWNHWRREKSLDPAWAEILVIQPGTSCCTNGNISTCRYIKTPPRPEDAKNVDYTIMRGINDNVRT